MRGTILQGTEGAKRVRKDRKVWLVLVEDLCPDRRKNKWFGHVRIKSNSNHLKPTGNEDLAIKLEDDKGNRWIDFMKGRQQCPDDIFGS